MLWSLVYRRFGEPGYLHAGLQGEEDTERFDSDIYNSRPGDSGVCWIRGHIKNSKECSIRDTHPSIKTLHCVETQIYAHKVD